MDDELDTFMYHVGVKLNKKPEAMMPFITQLRDNWYDTLASLREIDDETWTSVLKFPTRLVKVIKDELKAPSDEDEEMIDTSKPAQSLIKRPVIKDIHMENNEDNEEVKKEKPEGLKDGKLSVLFRFY